MVCNYGHIKNKKGHKLKTKKMDVQMSDYTLKLESEIKKVNGVSKVHSRQAIMAEAIEKLHKKMFKPVDINRAMGGTENE